MLAKKLKINTQRKELSQKFNIVLIDQNEMLLNLLDHELDKRKEFSVTHISNGVQFLNNEEVLPDLIIMDLILEGVNGIELIKKIRNKERFNQSKIIVLSEKINDSDANQLKSLKIDVIIQKPVNVGEVLFKIEEVIKD